MPRRVPGKNGTIAYVEFEPAELAQLLEVDVDALESWSKAIPPAKVEDGRRLYTIRSKAEVSLLKKRSAILRTGMSEKALANIEREDLLDAYAALAEDCPEGLTAHIWRSYGLVVLMQQQHGIKIDAEELARRARLAEIDPATGKQVLGVGMAKKHLRLLQALGRLRSLEPGDRDASGKVVEEPRWEHSGLPQAWARLSR